MADPRDGLTLFGPLDAGSPHGMRVGVVGTTHGIDRYRDWVARIQGPLMDGGRVVANPPYPGFATAFRIPWSVEPTVVLPISAAALQSTVFLSNRHERVYKTVGLFADSIVNALRVEDRAVDLWFVVIPDVVHENCRPLSQIARSRQVISGAGLTPRTARRLWSEPSLFPAWNEAAETYHYEVDFHDQLKARLLHHHAPTQIVRESTLYLPGTGEPEPPRGRDKRKLQAAVAWSLSTAAFYKAGGRPWKIDSIREGVCYVGLVFKQDLKHQDPRTACCAAQMFLDSGDGVVFRGAVGPWLSRGRSEFHLSRTAARELVSMAVASYESMVGHPPRELFIHGKVYFEENEWEGFKEGVDPAKTNLVAVRIRDEFDFRLYRTGTRPVLRGTALLRSARSAYLWTRGFVPRLRSYIGRDLPRPLRVDILRGAADPMSVLADVLALTKLNYNTCILGDGLPVTLRFADHVGEVLTAAPIGDANPLPFKLYI
jgi:hypothetical protein